MKRTVLKRMLSLLTSIVMTISVLTFAPMTSSAASGTYGVLSYGIVNGEITITDCDENVSGMFGIPGTIDSYPVTKIGYGAFADCSSLMGVVLPDSVTGIGEMAFLDCSNLTEVVLPDSLTSIGYGAFANCSSLTDIVLPDSLTIIGYGAFADCSGLTDIVLPDSVTGIGEMAFKNCIALKDIVLPDGVKSIRKWAFSGCGSLTDIVIPDGVTSIEYAAFSGCISLTDIVIPDSMTSIGNWAFEDCVSLTGVVLPNSITYIGGNAFKGCISLTDIVIPDSVNCIPVSAFAGCKNLTTVVIPDSVWKIDFNAFENCVNIDHVLYSGTRQKWKNISINSDNQYIEIATPHYEADSSAISVVSKIKPTCDTEGKVTYHCSICDNDFTVTLPRVPFIPALNPTENYTDVKTGAWYYDAVNYALIHNLFNGTSPTTFAPDVAMTRGMLVQVLYNLEGKPTLENKNIKFTDVKEKDWFADAVIWAEANGVVNGMTATTFAPNDVVTREQMTTILYRYADLKKYDVNASSDLTKFPDGNKVSSYAVDSLKWAVGAGLISGNKIGGVDMLDARGSATRAQVAKILRGFCENVMK